MDISQEELRDVVHYNSETGLFTWKIRGRGRRKDKSAGYLNQSGYVRISINGKYYLAHRLAWLYVCGYLPENQIDHIDRVRNNNSLENLREASRSCNMRNSGKRSDNTSGIKGVHFDSGKWRAQIMVNSKNIHLGSFDDILDAAKARHKAEVEHDFPDCNTDSTALKFVIDNENINGA